MYKYLVIATLVFINASCFAQALKPSITGGEFPEDGAGIYVEKVPEVKGWDDFMGGFETGATMPDLTFYTVEGKQVTLSAVLKETHKPVLLISGNYSCNVFRRNVPEINELTEFYGGKLNVYVVYTIEAHPVMGKQAYPLIPPAVKQNEAEHIRMKQAGRYLDRRKAAAQMTRNMSLKPTVLLDGPGNEWWTNSGHAPNNAYLINTHGRIVAKNGWFNSSMWCSIDRLLKTRSGHCQAVALKSSHKAKCIAPVKK